MIAVYAGRMNEKKGLEAVLSMAARCPDALFVLVGSEGEGPVERAARALNNVFIVPWQRPHDTATYLYAADVLLVPPSASPLTQHGTTVLPMKIFLYLAAGRVILAPNAPDTAEVLEHDHNAVLIPPGNIDAAVDALQALGRDELWRKRLERAALQSGHDLTWDGRAEKLERFLNERLTAIDPQSEATRSRKANWFRQTARWLYERTKRGAA
jgi:glycosyltransferase involved in cell wall biosynthesis